MVDDRRSRGTDQNTVLGAQCVWRDGSLCGCGAGAEIYTPMRIVENGEGAEVLFTLFRQPGMSDEKFAADANWENMTYER